MIIDGKAVAEEISADCARRIKELHAAPTLAVIQVGDDPASTAYIRQKQKAAGRVGAKLIHSHQPSAISHQQLQQIIEMYNADSSVHGLIVQRPLPEGLRADGVLPSKDIDGFLPDSPYPVPVSAAVGKILYTAFSQLVKLDPLDRYNSWLRKQSVIVIGRGETAGKPIAEALVKHADHVTVVHSQTPNPDDIIKTGDIVVSCVGKPNVVRRDNMKNGAGLISVGIWRDQTGFLRGDYREEEIASVASWYTPTPGGVGPVNVACLMANLLSAATKLL